jgi:uracil-DNA glycosylase
VPVVREPRISRYASLQTFIPEPWRAVLRPEFDKPYFQKLVQFLCDEDLRGVKIAPRLDDTFQALACTPPDAVKVGILFQTPYTGLAPTGQMQAHGLASSVVAGVPLPPTLRNVFKECADTVAGFRTPRSGDLRPWAARGVLLLNIILTAPLKRPSDRERTDLKHANRGWEQLTQAILAAVAARGSVVFLAWGSVARNALARVDTSRCRVLTAGHPSPLSVHLFLGCNHFNLANEALVAFGRDPVDWTLPSTTPTPT